MAKSSKKIATTKLDSPFEAEPSLLGKDTSDRENPSASSASEDTDEEDINDKNSEYDDQEEYDEEGLVPGMDPTGFIGDKTLKPLTPEALAEFKAAQDRAGVIYISRIPPGMQPPKVRHLMGKYGEVGRVYLQQEGVCMFPQSYNRIYSY